MVKKLLLSLCLTFMLVSGAAFSADKINVNTANVEQLQMIKGVGSSTANAIVKYRKDHGEFKSVSDLVQVKGIGNKKLEKLSNQVTVKD